VIALLYGISRIKGAEKSEFYLMSHRFRMTLPKIHSYVGNRLTQANFDAADAFKTVVNEIGKEIFAVWQSYPGNFAIHPNGQPPPRTQPEFRKMFQAEINDANTASVISGALGIPMATLAAKYYALTSKRKIRVNQSQLNKQVPNLRSFVATIE
jgi:hypothetical protein